MASYDVASDIWQALGAGRDRHALLVLRAVVLQTHRQGLTLVHFPAQPKPFWSHLPVSPYLIDWGEIIPPTYPTNCAYVEQNSGLV